MRTPNAILRGGPSDGRKLRADQCLSLLVDGHDAGQVARYRRTQETEGAFAVYRFAEFDTVRLRIPLAPAESREQR